MPAPKREVPPLELPQESRSTAGNGAAGAAPAALPADLDGARLIALNMALNGDPREATDRYLELHFDLPEREKLIDEVYAAIEG